MVRGSGSSEGEGSVVTHIAIEEEQETPYGDGARREEDSRKRGKIVWGGTSTCGRVSGVQRLSAQRRGVQTSSERWADVWRV